MIALSIEVNTPLCSGCRLCQVVCSLCHEGAVNLEKARISITDDYDHSLFLPHICQLCQPAPCVAACPTQALTQNLQSRVVSVNMELCNGCQACVAACPYEAIWWREAMNRLFVCDRCGGKPQCLEFCTSGALTQG